MSLATRCRSKAKPRNATAAAAIVDWAFGVLIDIADAREWIAEAAERSAALAALVELPEWSNMIAAVQARADPTLKQALRTIDGLAAASGLNALGPDAGQLFNLGYQFGFATAEIAVPQAELSRLDLPKEEGMDDVGEDEKGEINRKHKLATDAIYFKLLNSYAESIDGVAKFSLNALAGYICKMTEPVISLRDPDFVHLSHLSQGQVRKRLIAVGRGKINDDKGRRI